MLPDSVMKGWSVCGWWVMEGEPIRTANNRFPNTTFQGLYCRIIRAIVAELKQLCFFVK